MKKLVAFVSVLVISAASVSVSFAQSTQKIAVVHVQRILQEAPKVAEINQKLKDEFQPRQDELAQVQQTVQEEVADLNKNATIMEEGGIKAAQEKIAKERADFLQEANTLQTEFNQAQTGFMKDVFEDLNVVITRLAKDKGYDVVLDSQAVAFADPTLDITNDVLAAFNNS